MCPSRFVREKLINLCLVACQLVILSTEHRLFDFGERFFSAVSNPVFCCTWCAVTVKHPKLFGTYSTFKAATVRESVALQSVYLSLRCFEILGWMVLIRDISLESFTTLRKQSCKLIPLNIDRYLVTIYILIILKYLNPLVLTVWPLSILSCCSASFLAILVTVG